MTVDYTVVKRWDEAESSVQLQLYHRIYPNPVSLTSFFFFPSMATEFKLANGQNLICFERKWGAI